MGSTFKNVRRDIIVLVEKLLEQRDKVKIKLFGESLENQKLIICFCLPKMD